MVSGNYLHRQYLLWTLKDLLDIINGSELHSSNFVSTFWEKLSFSKLYDFIESHKQFVYNKNIPHTPCLCDTCKNICWLKVRIIINDLQLQLVFLKHRMISLKNTAVYLTTNFDDCTECSSGRLCQLPDSNAYSESDLDSDSDTSCLVLFYHWETPDKHVTKLDISEPFEEATRGLKNPLCLSRDIFFQKDPKTVIIIS